MNFTDINKIEQITKDFFENEVKQHALEQQQRMFPGITLDDIQRLYKSINQLLPWDVKMIDNAQSARGFLEKVDSKLRLKLFMKIKDYMNLQDYSENIMYTYTTGLTGQLSSDEWCEMFREADKQFMMEQSDYETYCSLPDVVTLYRGSSVDDDVQDAANRLSWSLEMEQADWFANREFNMFKKEYAVLMKADIPKDRVIALREGEHEVIVDILDYDVPYEIIKEYE